jgi:hypothetical protein
VVLSGLRDGTGASAASGGKKAKKAVAKVLVELGGQQQTLGFAPAGASGPGGLTHEFARVDPGAKMLVLKLRAPGGAMAGAFGGRPLGQLHLPLDLPRAAAGAGAAGASDPQWYPLERMPKQDAKGLGELCVQVQVTAIGTSAGAST